MVVYSSGTKESTDVTSLERWLRDLLDAARLEVSGDDGGGDGCVVMELVWMFNGNMSMFLF